MRHKVEPEPTDEEREAILAALVPTPDEPSAWAEAARRESVENEP
jgi:hypothetical protein